MCGLLTNKVMTTTENEFTDNEADCHEFKIQSGSTNFNKKKESIFGSLAELEQKHADFEKICPNSGDYIKSDPIEDSCIDDRPKGKNDRVDRVVRGGNFRARRPTPYNQPSFRREPCKWTKYDLSDVDASMMSERSNKAAAMSFLSNLRDQKKQQEEAEPIIHGKVIFKKPTATTTVAETKETSASCSSGGRIVLPEYDFGSKREKTKKVKSQTVAVADCNRLQLSHLADLEDEAGDEDD